MSGKARSSAVVQSPSVRQPISTRRKLSSPGPSPTTRRDRHPDGRLADGDVGRVFGPGLHVNGRQGAAVVVGHEGGFPSGVIATSFVIGPMVMSVGFLVLVFTSIVETVLLAALVTKAVARHRPRASTADTPSGTTPTSAPANPNSRARRTHRNRRITAPGSLS